MCGSTSKGTEWIAVATLLLVFGTNVYAQRTIKLEDLSTGIVLTEQARFRIAEIRIGTLNVKNLFRDMPWQEPSRSDYYLFKRIDTNVRIRGLRELDELRQLLGEHDSTMTIVLTDGTAAVVKKVWRDQSLYRRERKFMVTLPVQPCKDITRIVYDEVSARVKETLTAQTEQQLNLNAVFDLLMRDQIKQYMARHPAAKDDPCFHDFQLWKWLNGAEAQGFGSGKYRIHAGLQDLLSPAIDALNDVRSAWEHHYLNIRILGYTDPDNVKKTKIDLRFADTGLTEMSRARGPWDVRYEGCSGDNLDGGAPHYVALGEHRGRRIVSKISNNCELGAVRAYVAAMYLDSRLMWTNVEYSYATGGERSPRKTDDGGAMQRAVHVEMVVKAARRSRPGQ